MKYKAYLMNSLDTVFYDSEIDNDTLEYAQMFKNEAFSFQVAFKAELEPNEGNGWNDVTEIRAEVKSELKNKINVYFVENVPAIRVGYSTSDDWFLRKTPGLYPDCLHRRKGDLFSVPVGYWKGVWINVNEQLDEVAAGSYEITLNFYERKTDKIIAHRVVTVEVMDRFLPKQDIVLTNWFHYDCISYFSETEPFSEDYLCVLRKYILMAAKNGQNMILTPAFTPPLDTPIGGERKTAQLVSIEKNGDEYFFDFSMLKNFIELALECGIEYFEHSHLFTQWGAEHTPKIIINEGGKALKFFGWNTDACSDEYKNFLHSYLTALKAFLKNNGYEKRFFFHISDEPDEKHLKNYEKLSNFLHNELAEYPSGDALSEYAFYKDGLVQTPIVVTRSIKNFLGKADPLWLYYTGYECDGNMSNRLIGMPQERGRILGVELYYFGIKGFLNWGFNAHHNRLSRMMINPRMSSDMDCDFVGGTSYVVYSDGKNVDASVRLMTMRDQMQDTRALRLLEQLTDREYVMSIIRRYIPDISFNCRVSANQILNLRKTVNEEIKEHTGNKRR